MFAKRHDYTLAPANPDDEGLHVTMFRLSSAVNDDTFPVEGPAAHLTETQQFLWAANEVLIRDPKPNMVCCGMFFGWKKTHKKPLFAHFYY